MPSVVRRSRNMNAVDANGMALEYRVLTPPRRGRSAHSRVRQAVADATDVGRARYPSRAVPIATAASASPELSRRDVAVRSGSPCCVEATPSASSIVIRRVRSSLEEGAGRLARG